MAVSVFSLASALTAELLFGLEPCILCIYQRIPFVVAIILGVTGLLLRKNKQAAMLVIFLCSPTFLANSAIAFYHSGVERHWWRSFFEGCAVPDLSGDAQSLLENILSAPTARCDEIPWADPMLGLSMANYNVILCFGLFVGCLLSAFLMKRGSAL